MALLQKSQPLIVPMKLAIYQVDAFASKSFTGNPAAVVPLDEWLPDDILQAIAEENNLAETAFFVASGEDYAIRWFTPTVEVDLCGHATLASAHVLFAELGLEANHLVFQSRSGPLLVESLMGSRYRMGFPTQAGKVCDLPAGLVAGLGDGFRQASINECLFYEDYIVVLESEQAVAEVTPNFNLLASVPARGIIVTAKGSDVDFVCRFFGPAVGVNEDAVTGSAFTKLVPYWVNEFGRTKLSARQISTRGGSVDCELQGDTVYLSGDAITFLRGDITLS